MSRRTRISRDIRRRKLGTNHHSIYSSSSTSFPASYSIFGTPISMPAKILPLIDNNKINYVSRPDQLLYNQWPLINLQYQHIRNAKQVNLTIAGKLIQKQNKIMTRIVFFFSMILCCLLGVFATSCFRKKFYAKYKTTLEQYRKLSGVLSQLENCQKLILNIQDNDLNDQKIQLIESALLGHKEEQNKLESDRQITHSRRKKITIRNFCYFMNEMDIKKSFKHLMENENIDFIFVWQKQVINSNINKGKNSDSESALGTIFSQ